MLKQRNEQIQAATRGLDLLICITAFFAAYSLQGTAIYSLANYGSVASIESVSWLLVASIVVHLILYPLFGFYTSLRMKSIFDIIRMILSAAVIEFFILGALVFFVQAKTTSRYFFGLFLLVNYSLVFAERIGARVLLAAIRKRGYNFRQVLIVGTGKAARKIIQTLERNAHWGYIPCGVLTTEANADFEPDSPHYSIGNSVPRLGTLSDLESLIKNRVIDEIIFALDRIDAAEISEQIQLCEKLGVPTRLSLELFDLQNSRVTFSHMDQIPLITFYTTLRTPFEVFVKRAMDIAISIIGLVLTIFLIPFIAWGIRRQSPGPILFKQFRVGENGRLFRCYKFRTMMPDAESSKADLLGQNEMNGPLFKIENDPRIFPFGAFMRRTSLDELPQFFNILRGDMSVVGTRPPTPDEVEIYETRFRRRLSVRPGLTGLWQVSGRNNIRNFEDVLKLDVEYIDRWSIGLDIRIIFKTVWVTLFRRGAF